MRTNWVREKLRAGQATIGCFLGLESPNVAELLASHYTFDNEDYFNRVNDNILVTLILETKEAVDNLEAIASVPGIDAIYLGPWDLCLSLGLNPLHQPYPEINAIIERMVAVAR